MATAVTPVNQKQFLDPYSSRLFDFDNVNSRVYLARTINSLMHTIGEDCILRGLEITNLNYDGGSDLISCTVNPGKAIVDATLIEITDIVDLDLDVTNYVDTGFIIVSLGFAYLQTVYQNLSKLKMTVVSADGNEVNPEPWFLNHDRLVLAKFDFDKTTQTVRDISKAMHPPGEPLVPMGRATVKGQEYHIRKPSLLAEQLDSQLRETFYL